METSKFLPHLFSIQMFGLKISRKNNVVKEGQKWTKIKSKIKLDTSMDKAQTKQLWNLLQEFQNIFIWHKGELGHCSIKEHAINTQGLPPCYMTLSRLSCKEEIKVNYQILALIELGKHI